MHEHRRERGLVGKRRERRLAEDHRLHAAEDRGKCDAEGEQQERSRPRVLAHRGREDQELAREDAEGRHAQDSQCSDHEAPTDGRAHLEQPADVVHHLRARFLRRVPHGEEDRALHERVHGHVQQAREIRDRPAHPEGERHEAHVLD